MKRLVTLLAAFLLFIAACGDGSDDSTVAPTTSAAPTSQPATSVPATTVAPTTSVTPTTATSVTIGPTTPPTITSPPNGDSYVAVFFPVDGLIAPVARPLGPGEAPEVVAVAALLDGPTADEIAGTPSMSGVADGAELLGISIEGDTVTVDISGEFNAPTGTSGELMRLSTLTYTLTDLPAVDQVILLIDGERLQYFGGHGWDITPSLTRTTFMENQGAFGSIAILDPAWWLPVATPVTVSGYARGFEGKVMFGLYDYDGLEIATGEAAVTPTRWDLGLYEITIPFSVDFAQLGSLMVWDGSEGAGTQANLVEQAIWLLP